MNIDNTDLFISQIHHRFSLLKAGIIFTNVAQRRIQLSLKLVEEFLSNIEYIIWIAPSNFLKTLKYTNEIKLNSQTFRHRILYYSVETISVSDRKFLELYNIIRTHKTFCIIDEGLTIKNSEAQKTKRFLMLSKYFTYKLILSSVPVAQGLIDLYSQLKFLNSHLLKMNEKQFNNIFMKHTYQSYMIKRHWSRPQDEKKLIEIMKPYILGYDLREKYITHHYNYYFELTPKEQESYLEEKEKYIQNKKKLVFIDIVQSFQRMYSCSKNKLFGLQRTVNEILNRKEKALIYIKYLDELDFIRETKILKDIPFAELRKGLNKKKAIKSFEKNTDIMFCTYGVEKFELNMQLCNNIIYFSQTFDYHKKSKILDSVSFKGIPSTMNIYDFWVKTNLEDFIRDILDHKHDMFSNVHKNITCTEVLKL